MKGKAAFIFITLFWLAGQVAQAGNDSVAAQEQEDEIALAQEREDEREWKEEQEEEREREDEQEEYEREEH